MARGFLPFIFMTLLFFVSLFSIPYVGKNFHDLIGYLIFIVFVVELPLLVVIGRDALINLNTFQEGNLTFRFVVRAMASLPSIIFSVTSILIGLSIIGWVLYNVIIERMPQYSGSMLIPSLGIGPALIYWGWSTLKAVFGSEVAPEENDDSEEEEDELN